jgi:hypothetical protein
MVRSSFVGGQLSFVSAGRDQQKKQSQTKPLMLTAFGSITYAEKRAIFRKV